MHPASFATCLADARWQSGLYWYHIYDVPQSQANALLNQLAADWNAQYDTIAELIALQMIVYLDETGWKVGTKSCYTWVFSTAMHVLFRCGVSRKKEEATAVLGDAFAGIGVTDDYNAYKKLFSKHQLCWAHLIRKAKGISEFKDRISRNFGKNRTGTSVALPLGKSATG